MKYIQLLFLGLIITACSNKIIQNSEVKQKAKDFEFGVWISADAKRSDESYSVEF